MHFVFDSLGAHSTWPKSAARASQKHHQRSELSRFYRCPFCSFSRRARLRVGPGRCHDGERRRRQRFTGGHCKDGRRIRHAAVLRASIVRRSDALVPKVVHCVVVRRIGGNPRPGSHEERPLFCAVCCDILADMPVRSTIV